ncbi:MAG TPA: cysteine-rich CWC family protein [Pyrinomonadaceae bacterium]|nr:cysteine-rich CWC family protein [Pyrinomonadaceae bacterium]
MKLSELLTRVLPTLNRPQHCPACGEAFACEIGLQGCWCSEVELNPSTLKALREKYKGCLCRSCLEKAERLEPDARA